MAVSSAMNGISVYVQFFTSAFIRIRVERGFEGFSFDFGSHGRDPVDRTRIPIEAFKHCIDKIRICSSIYEMKPRNSTHIHHEIFIL